ncbi:hypothetical protein FRC01_002120 [Tulasnella sp. 417]|nr:hypothetical protein FRC01_002120 [Tulasnella sp. 417]
MKFVSASAVIPRNHDKCYTVHEGYLTTQPGEHPTKFVPVGLSSKKQVTYGAGDPWLKVEFQTCPKLPEQAPSLDIYKGRIIVSGSSHTNGTITTPNCVTVSSPTAPNNGPFFLGVKRYASETNPPPSQRWEYGKDFGDVVYWVSPPSRGWVLTGASKGDEVGYTIDSQLNPVVEKGTRRIKLGCTVSCSTFAIKAKNEL